MSCNPINNSLQESGLNEPFLVLTKHASGSIHAHCLILLGQDITASLGFNTPIKFDYDGDGVNDAILIQLKVNVVVGAQSSAIIVNNSFDLTLLNDEHITCIIFELIDQHNAPSSPVKSSVIQKSSSILI